MTRGFSGQSPWEGVDVEPLDGTWLSGKHLLRLRKTGSLTGERGSSFFHLDRVQSTTDLGSVQFPFGDSLFRSTGLIHFDQFWVGR